MARNDYTCAVCGKTLTIAGPRNIELHEKSKFHMAAVDKAKKEQVIDQPPESEPTNEPANEPVNEIRTTTPEGKNDKKETGKRDSGDSGDSGASGDNRNDSEWDGYLC